MAVKQITTNYEIEEYEFLDKNGKHLYTIPLNPGDFDIVRRYDAFMEWMNGVKLPEDAGIEEMYKLTDEYKQKLDFLLNANVSDEIFSVMNPFSFLADGRTYAECVLDGIGQLIESEFKEREKKVQNRMNKYTAKYQK